MLVNIVSEHREESPVVPFDLTTGPQVIDGRKIVAQTHKLAKVLE